MKSLFFVCEMLVKGLVLKGIWRGWYYVFVLCFIVICVWVVFVYRKGIKLERKEMSIVVLFKGMYRRVRFFKE